MVSRKWLISWCPFYRPNHQNVNMDCIKSAGKYMYLNISLLKISTMKTRSDWIKLDLMPTVIAIWAHYLSSLEFGVNETKVRGSIPIWDSKLHIKTAILFLEFTPYTLFYPYASCVFATGHKQKKDDYIRLSSASLLVERLPKHTFLKEIRSSHKKNTAFY